MANNENYTYANLITKVIENFDEIYSVLKSKGSVYNSAVLPTPAGTNMDTGIATDEYANILNDNLVKVDGLLVDDLSLNGGIMRNFKDLDISVNSGSSIDYTNKTLTLAKGSLGAAGYYDGNKVIIGITDKLSSATITNFATPTEDNKKYVLTPTNTIISSVTIDQGSVNGEVELQASDVTGEIPKAEVTAKLDQSQTIASTDAIANGIKLTFTTTPVLSGKINTVVKSKDITEGYIKAEDVTITGGQYDIKDVTVQGATSEYWISKGSVGIDADESSVSHDLVSDHVLFGTGASDGYAITSKVDSVTVVPTVTAGYVTSTADTDFSADLKPADVVKYIKKGSVVGKEQKTAAVSVVDGSKITTTSNDADNYVITVSTQDTVVEHTVTEGYIKPEDTTQVPNITVSGDSKTIKIAKGSAVVSSAVTESNIQVTAGGDYLSSKGGKAITITATPTNSKGTFKAGYFESNAQITNTTATPGSRTFNITEGSVSLNNPTISCTAVNFTDTNSTVTSQIFKTSAPQNGEYYEIDAAVTGTVTPGWIDDADLNKSATVKYYVPKATFNFVKSEKGDANEFIQVTTGGYIPSGAIVELGSELSEADYAVVELNASDADSGIIMTSAAAQGDYSITVSKGTVNAGYISDAKGAVTAHVINIKHGSVETTADVNTNITADSLTIATEASNGKYAVGFNVGGTVKTTISEGYVKVADLEVNGEESKNNTSVEFNKNYSIDLNAGAVSISTEGISGSVAAGGGVEFADSSAYYVEPTISGNGVGGAATLNVSVATPGYIGTDYNASANVTLGQSSDIRKYIKQGTALTSVAGSGTVSITNNFNENVDEYTISLTNPNATTIGVSGTLQTGYYGDNEKNVSGSATVTGLAGTTKIARGKVQPTSVSTSISYEGLTDGITTTAPTGSNYIHLTASEGAATITRTVTAGYVKDNATDAPTNVANVTVSGTELYVRTYTNSNVTTAGNYLGGNVGEMTEAEASVSSWVENGAAVELESDKIVIDTAHKYSEKNIEVTLDADAAGKNVRSELYRLQQRLAGANATIRSLV